MEIDLPDVIAEVSAAFARYERALVSNDVATLNELFREDGRTLRYGSGIAVASTLFYRDTLPGKVGRQMQTWVRFPEGWRIVAAHVSVIDEPKRPKRFGFVDFLSSNLIPL